MSHTIIVSGEISIFKKDKDSMGLEVSPEFYKKLSSPKYFQIKIDSLNETELQEKVKNIVSKIKESAGELTEAEIQEESKKRYFG